MENRYTAKTKLMCYYNHIFGIKLAATHGMGQIYLVIVLGQVNGW